MLKVVEKRDTLLINKNGKKIKCVLKKWKKKLHSCSLENVGEGFPLAFSFIQSSTAPAPFKWFPIDINSDCNVLNQQASFTFSYNSILIIWSNNSFKSEKKVTTNETYYTRLRFAFRHQTTDRVKKHEWISCSLVSLYGPNHDYSYLQDYNSLLKQTGQKYCTCEQKKEADK